MRPQIHYRFEDNIVHNRTRISWAGSSIAAIMVDMGGPNHARMWVDWVIGLVGAVWVAVSKARP